MSNSNVESVARLRRSRRTVRCVRAASDAPTPVLVTLSSSRAQPCLYRAMGGAADPATPRLVPRPPQALSPKTARVLKELRTAPISYNIDVQQYLDGQARLLELFS
ncbi:hypothetical protein ACJJTC_011742 [Scirpophaga incertulas]